MLYRCYNPKRNKHQFYADRGVSVCARWHTFDNFVEDMGIPAAGETLDRIDNSKGYCPENCRWVPQRAQKLNRGRWGKRKYKGVRKNGERYISVIRSNGTDRYLGTFDTAAQAACAYNEALLANGDNPKYCNIVEEDEQV